MNESSDAGVGPSSSHANGRPALEPMLPRSSDAIAELPPIRERPLLCEEGLLAAVIKSALDDLDRGGRLGAHAAAWIFGDDLGGTGWSVEEVCTLLDLDPIVLRRMARSTGSRGPARRVVRGDRPIS